MRPLNSLLLEPSDPALGELTPSERRVLIRRIAELVGTEISSRVQDAAESGRPMTAEAERVAAASEIQRALSARTNADSATARSGSATQHIKRSSTA